MAGARGGPKFQGRDKFKMGQNLGKILINEKMVVMIYVTRDVSFLQVHT